MNLQIRNRLKHGDFQHAFAMYQKLCENNLPIDETTYLALLKACTELKDATRGSNIHSQVAENGLLKQHPLIGNTLVNMYARCGVFKKAQEVFDELPIRDVVSWNVLLAGLVKHDRAVEALEWYEHMQLEGLLTDSYTYVCLLKACGSIGAADKGKELHEEIAIKGLLNGNLILGNSLLDMYASCGFLSKAEEIFDNLEIRDRISWNTLMTGYVNSDNGEKALQAYGAMELNDVSPNAVTFVCGLKACALISETNKGQEIHAVISRHPSLQRNLVIGNTLIDMYAKWGWINKAREVFDKLVLRDLNSWNILISAYAKLDFAEEALTCLEKMEHDGIVPDAVTYASSLKACGSMGNAVKGRDIHFEIERRGPLVTNLVVCTSLLDMYANCGWLMHARDVFCGLLVRDLVSWNALIGGYVDCEYCKEALSCLEQMHKEKISPNAITYACCLKACGILKLFEQGGELYAEIARKGLPDSDYHIGTALVDMYAKCGLVIVAQELFDNLPMHSLDSWTTLIKGYVDIGFAEEALMCLEQVQLEGIFLDGILLACSLKACGTIGAAQYGKSLHARFAENGILEKDPVAGSVLVDMYANCGLPREAQLAFSRVLLQDIVSWNTLIAGYARYEMGMEASKCVEQMGLEGVEPDMITMLCELRASFNFCTPHELERLVDDNAISFEGNLYGSNILVDIYAKLGHFSKAIELLHRLPAQNSISWNSLIAGLVKHEQNEEALECLEQMQAEGMLPDIVTFLSSLKACSSIGAFNKGEELHVDIARRGLLKADTTVCNALMDMYAKCSQLAKAEEVFTNILFQNVISWNVLISGHAQLGNIQVVFALVNEMRRDNQKPDESTFVSVLYACSQAALVKRGQLLFESMSKDFGVVPNLQHYTCMINLFSRVGDLHQAMVKTKDLPFKPDFAVWLSILNSCRRLGDAQLGQEAYRYASSSKMLGANTLH